MSDEYGDAEPEPEREPSKRTRSVTKRCVKVIEDGDPNFVKNIPSYISCIITTTTNFLLSFIFSTHCVYYYNLYITLAIVFTLSITAITFVGTFKAVI